MKLWYEQPAASWIEALPIGNGRLGAMVFGCIKKEIISLNEDSLWSGYPRDLNPKNKTHCYQDAVKLTKEGKFLEAQSVIESNLTSGWSQSYLPLGDLILDFKTNSKESGYIRCLDLDTAILTVEYEIDGVKYKREMFSSAPQNVMVIRISADKKNSISFSMGLDSQLKPKVNTYNQSVVLQGEAPAYVEPSYIENCDNPVLYFEEDEKRGMLYEMRAKLINFGGRVTHTDTTIQIDNADSAVILVTAQTSFAGFDVHPFLNGKDFELLCQKDLYAVSDMSYDELLENHIKDYKSYYDRVYMNLGESEASLLPTDKRLYRFQKEKDDKSLYTLLFQYGRYLLISASRQGTQATNLQGIWSSQLRPAWSSNYTININTQMNYWPVFSCALGEMQQPLNTLIKELAVTGEITAKDVYGVRGFTSHHNSDIWRLSSPVGNKQRFSAGYAFWNMSSAWLCRHLYDQYEYTLDKIFLEDEAYPIMKSAAKFLLDIIAEDKDGYLIICPSTSPENTFIYEDEKCNVSPSATMSIAIARELFTNCIKSCEILKTDYEFKKELETVVEKLYPYKIGSKGQLLEWYDEYEEENPHHRHISHLYGLHPANEITVEDCPELAKACETTLNIRGDDGTGWSLAWKINQWARLFDGDRALKLLNRQLRVVGSMDEEYKFSTDGGTYINMFDAHPPFQIDGNFGAVSGIAEMLVQSRDNKVFILPALPSEWKNGTVNGLRAKGRIQVNIEWNGNKVITSLLSDKDQKVLLYLGSKMHSEISLSAGVQKVINSEIK